MIVLGEEVSVLTLRRAVAQDLSYVLTLGEVLVVLSLLRQR
jgi:hypothetical protein